MYYYSFLTSVDKSKCDVYVTDIYKACSLEVVGELKKIQKECAESNSMVKGPENAQRKDTIKRSVFDQHEKTLLELKTIGFAGINLLDN